MEGPGTMLGVKEVLFTSEEIQDKVREIGGRVNEDYAGEKLLLVGILSGSVVVLSDLMRHIELPCEIDFMDVSSYGGGTTSSGDIRILKDLNRDVTDCHVLVVEDIVDTGLTLSHLSNLFESRGVATLEICTLLSKPSRRKIELDIKYLGFEIPDEFVVGYGIDFGQFRTATCPKSASSSPKSLKKARARQTTRERLRSGVPGCWPSGSKAASMGPLHIIPCNTSELK